MQSTVGYDFLADGGEMGALMRAFDWSTTPLGPPQGWPASLRAAVRILLNTGHPMFIWWGPELIQFYNDAYRTTMGPERHPSALGQRGRECWGEIWHIIGPQIDYVMSGQGSTWDEDALVPVTRHGRREDVWWTYSYGPIDHEGGVGGVLVVCNDVTEQHRIKDALADQNQRLATLFEQAPSFIAVMRGPEHRFELVNASYRRLIGNRDVIGKPVVEALPEVAEQGFIDLLDKVYRTGEPHVGRRAPVQLQFAENEPLKKVYLDFVYQPIVDPNGSVSGIFVEGVDVTEHVRTGEHLRLVNDELKHRVKNTLAMVSAIATQTLRGTGSDAALAAFQARLGTFGKAHDMLTANAWATVPVGDVVSSALEAYRTGEGRFRISGGPVEVGAKQALSLALAIHELATNASKYGALSADGGHVDISWQTQAGDGAAEFELIWRESDGPLVSAPTRTGFGTQLIQRVLSADFGGDVDLRYEPSGVVCRLSAPVDNLLNSLPSPFSA